MGKRVADEGVWFRGSIWNRGGVCSGCGRAAEGNVEERRGPEFALLHAILAS